MVFVGQSLNRFLTSFRLLLGYVLIYSKTCFLIEVIFDTFVRISQYPCFYATSFFIYILVLSRIGCSNKDGYVDI